MKKIIIPFFLAPLISGAQDNSFGFGPVLNPYVEYTFDGERPVANFLLSFEAGLTTGRFYNGLGFTPFEGDIYSWHQFEIIKKGLPTALAASAQYGLYDRDLWFSVGPIFTLGDDIAYLYFGLWKSPSYKEMSLSIEVFVPFNLIYKEW